VDWSSQAGTSRQHIAEGLAAAAAAGHPPLLAGKEAAVTYLGAGGPQAAAAVVDAQGLPAILELEDPIARQYGLFKSESTPVSPTLYGKLGLAINRTWGFSYFMGRLLAHTLLLMGWVSGGLQQPSAWEVLEAKLRELEEKGPEAAAACWVPGKTALAKTAFWQLGGSDLKPSKRGYLRLNTVIGPRKPYDTQLGIAKAKRAAYAHQIMCWAVHGPPPPGALLVRHLCGKPCCIRPGCLLWGTHAENAQDRIEHKERARRKGACKRVGDDAGG